MSMSLTEALKQVKLEPGKTYQCQVNGYSVEVRVSVAAVPPPSVEKQPRSVGAGAPATEVEPESSDFEDFVMLDPWVQLPEPPAAFYLETELGEPDPPFIPEIPEDEENA